MFQFNFSSNGSMVSSTSSSSATVSSSSLDGAVDDNKPNSLYGGSSGRFFASAAACMDDDDDDSVFGHIPLQTMTSSSPPFVSEEDEEYDGFGDEPLYMLEDAASAAHDPFPAECCVQRAASSRRERYFHTMGKKSGWYF
ncbi:hypothetical protein GGI20_005845 [Coemansia sp. BCRC 34301]|nr:hypothetical protein GGI20_005845 [Coemansia sp. BCRC 34301]